MNPSDREHWHQCSLERIQQVQLICGRGDRTRIDHEGTLFERARLLAEELSAHEATERGLAAYDRLLRLAEERSTPHTQDIADFITAVWNKRPLPLLALRGIDVQVGDDMLAVLDAFRHARLDLNQHVPGGPARVARAVAQALQRPSQT